MRPVMVLILLLGCSFMACDSNDKDSTGTTDTTQTPTDSVNPSDSTEAQLDSTTSQDLAEQVISPLHCPTDETGYATINVNEIALNVACRGQGPAIVFLHGFPEFSYAWENVMKELASEYRLIAPDQRGFNLSDKPEGIDAYHVDHLVEDIVTLLDVINEPKPILVGHDWGGPIAWIVAHKHPEKLKALVIANGPHPDIYLRELTENPEQKQASAYISLLLGPDSANLLSANDFALLKAQVFNDSFSEEDRAAYVTAWGQPNALPSMINWYRANLDFESGVTLPKNITVDIPTLVLWGMKDTALLSGNLVGLGNYVSNLKVIEFPNATHWIEHEDPKGIANAIREFDNGLDK